MPDLDDEAILPELYFLIAHFLSNGPYKESAKKLIEQLEANKELPRRIDWTGNEHPRTFQEMAEINCNIPPNFLLKACNQMRVLFDQNQAGFSKMKTLLGAGQFSILQDARKLEMRKKEPRTSNLSALPKYLHSNYGLSECLPTSSRAGLPAGGNMCSAYSLNKRSLNGNMNLVLNLGKREMDGRLDPLNIMQPEYFRNINIHKRIFGHLASIYCVLFDRTGRYIFTGADDNLIKVWCAADGRLVATLRGHDKEISDMDINYENTILASGSCDKTIRIWNLKTTETIAVLQSHNSIITSLEFCPQSSSTSRWLASSSSDGTVCFWQWNSQTLVFNPKPRKFIEKSRAGTQILCISFSPGGLMLATGSSDNMIRIYLLRADKVEKVFELETHKNVVDSIQYANNSLRFVSGSKDGMAHIWKYEHRSWNIIKIDASKTIQKKSETEASTSASSSSAMVDLSKKNSINMVTWNCDDSLVITSQGSFLVKVWNSNDGQLIHELKGHENDIYVLEAHPEDPRLLLSAGNEGFVFLWNILTGKMIKKFVNKSANEDPGWVFDTRWSPNLDMFASTDSSGHLVIFGFGSDDNYKNTPVEQFFHTDYRPLMRDQNDYVVDEQTQQPPHLMPPPFLVDADGNPYTAEYQRLVPGRNNSSDAALNPQVIINESGIPEIIIENDAADPAAEEAQPSTSAAAAAVVGGERNGRQRYQWVKDLIRPLDARKLETCEAGRLQKLEEEEQYYAEHHCSKGGPVAVTGTLFRCSNDDVGANKQQRRGRRSGRNGESAFVDRLHFKALYDTDNEAEVTIRVTNAHSHVVHSEYEEETRDHFVDVIDEDSNTMLSTGASFHATTANSSFFNNNSNLNDNDATNHSTTAAAAAAAGGASAGTSSRRNNAAAADVSMAAAADYAEPDASETESSEYSDWAQQEGHRSLKPPTSRARRQRKKRSRQQTRRRVQDDDDEAGASTTLNESTEGRVGRASARASKRVKRIVSDDDAEARCSDQSNSDEENNETFENEDESFSNEDEPVDEDDADEDEPMDAADRPCTSHAANSRLTRKPNKLKKRGRPPKSAYEFKTKVTAAATLGKSSKSASSKTAGKVVGHQSKLGKAASKPLVIENLKECPPEYRPPEWLTSIKPRKSPYVPQMGDEVVYFRQGHELYVQAVKQYNLYELDESSLPWARHGKSVGVQEFAKVVGLKIEIKPPRLVCVKLSVIDPSTGRATGSSFSIKYHDMPHVVDFVVLRQYYERGVEKDWRAKDRFRCIIDDVWWFGTIEAKRPYQDEHPDCPFQSLKVLWDSGGDLEDLSPWDLEPVSGPNARKTKSASTTAAPHFGESMAVSAEELKSLLYQPEEGEWPGEGRDSECDRIQAGLIKIMELSVAEAFNFPVDLDSFPTYAIQINYPIDLSTIVGRLENRYYRRLNSVQWDIRNIETNAIKFNEPHSLIVQNATLLVELLNEFVSDVHCSNPLPIYKRLCKSKKLSPAGSSAVAAAASTSTGESSLFDNDRARFGSSRSKRSAANFASSSGRHSSRSSLPSASQTSETYAKRQTYTLDGWINQCQKLLTEIMSDADSEPFRAPVDLVEFPDYVGIVETPIDFGTIGEKLRNGLYETIKEFDADCKMLFKNSRLYNTNKRSAIYAITMRLQGFYEERIQQVYKSHKAALKQKNQITSRYGREIKSRFNDTTMRVLEPSSVSNSVLLNSMYASMTSAAAAAVAAAGEFRRSTRNSGYETVPALPTSSSRTRAGPSGAARARLDETLESTETEPTPTTSKTAATAGLLNQSFLSDFDNENANHANLRAADHSGPKSSRQQSNEDAIKIEDEDEDEEVVTGRPSYSFNFNFKSADASRNESNGELNSSSANATGANENLTIDSLLQSVAGESRRSTRLLRADSETRMSYSNQHDEARSNGLAKKSSSTAGRLNGEASSSSKAAAGGLKRKRKEKKRGRRAGHKKKPSNKWNDSREDDEDEDEPDDDDDDYEVDEDELSEAETAAVAPAAPALDQVMANGDLYDREDEDEEPSEPEFDDDEEEEEEEDNDSDDEDYENGYVRRQTKAAASSAGGKATKKARRLSAAANNQSYETLNRAAAKGARSSRGRRGGGGGGGAGRLDNKENNANSVASSDHEIFHAAATSTSTSSRLASKLSKGASKSASSSSSRTPTLTRSSRRTQQQISYRETSDDSSGDEFAVK